MDSYNRTLEIVLSSLLGGGGLAALITAWRARKLRQRGVDPDESVAVAQAASHADPQWESITSLNRYWQKELATVRAEYAQHRLVCEQQRQADADRIDELEEHIWERKPPPPPPRRKGNP